jgi:YD repeat-containing protein
MFFRVARIIVILFVITILSQSRPLPTVILAQTTDPSLVFPTAEKYHNRGAAPPPIPDILPLSFLPPAEAEDMDDFISPAGQVASLAVPQAAFTDSASSFVPLAGANFSSYPQKQIDGQQETLITINENQLGIIIEEQTFTQTVQLVVPHFSRLQLAPEFANGQKPAGAVGNHPAAGPLTRFQLEVIDANNELVSTFQKQVRLVVDMRDYGLDLTEVGGYFYLAYEDVDEPGTWLEVPLTTYDKTGLISADVDHFSNWQAGWRPEAWALEWKPPVVNEFTGSASYQYPFQLPPGRNGLQPELSLSYSSASLRGAIRQVSFGTVATGWSLSDISITRTGIKNGETWWSFPNTFRLTINGVGGRLIQVGTEGDATRYRVEDAPQFMVYNYGGTSIWDDYSYWVVRHSNGTHYRLGFTSEAISWQGATGNNQQPYDYVDIIAWHVDTITDANGNQINYDYIQAARSESYNFWCSFGGVCGWNIDTITSQVSAIHYNFNNRITNLPPSPEVGRLLNSSNAATTITFTYDAEETRLAAINIRHGSGPYPVRRYVINAQTIGVDSPSVCKERLADGSHQTLISNTRVINTIQEQAWDTYTNQLVAALPATTFHYVTHHHFGHGGEECFLYRYLSAVINGYGGRTEIGYETDGRQEGTFNNCYGWQPGDPPCEQVWPTMGHNLSVKVVVNKDGRQPNGVKTIYTYHDRCYDQIGSCIQPDTHPDTHYGNIVGHGKVEVITYDYDGTTPLYQRITEYHYDDTDKLGKPYEQLFLGYSGNGNYKEYQRTETDYQYITLDGNVRFMTTEEVRSYQQAGAGALELSTKTRYVYDYTHQVGADGAARQYGQLSAVQEYDSATAATPYRTTRHWYRVNDQNGYWVIVPMSKGIYTGNSWDVVTATAYYYDGGAHGNLPTKGRLTRQNQAIPASCNDVDHSGCVHAQQLVDTYFSYDIYGNVKTTTTYPGYNYRIFDNNWQVIDETPPVGPARPTTITYENQYNLYPVAVKNALDHETTFEIYGFRNKAGHLVPLSGFQTQPGLLKEVKDPNNVTTRYEYDPFGRLHAIFDGHSFSGFGDTDPWNGDPVVLHRYWDNSWNHGTLFLDPAANAPFLISTHQRPGTWPNPGVSNGDFAYIDQTSYDGFGRPIQTRGLYAEVQGQSLRQEIITSTAYNAQGQVSCATVPYNVPFYSDRDGANWPYDVFISTPCTNKAHTATTYDALGRVKTVTTPDGAVSQHNYFVIDDITVNDDSLLRIDQVVDAKGHLVNRFFNSRGQLALVREYTGSDPYTDYADTRYTYDLMGNLTHVGTSNPTNNDPSTWLRETTMSYDGFGRKESMDDADMGAWTYSYDAAGNLKQQKDAKLKSC